MSSDVPGEALPRNETQATTAPSTATPEALLHAIQVNEDLAKRKADETRAAADRATRTLKFWQDLHGYLSRGWPLHVLRELDANQESLTALATAASEHPVNFAAIRQLAKEQADTQRRRFPGMLEQESNRLGLPLDREASRHPKYCFQGTFFQLEILESKAVARLSDNEGRLCEVPADVGAVLLAVEEHNKRVFGRPVEAQGFLRKLFDCYTAILRKEKLTDGASIPIRKITIRFGKNEKGFRTDEFLVDLSRLLEHGPTEISGYSLALQQTKDTNQGMLLLGSAGRGYIGFIAFRKATP